MSFEFEFGSLQLKKKRHSLSNVSPPWWFTPACLFTWPDPLMTFTDHMFPWKENLLVMVLLSVQAVHCILDQRMEVVMSLYSNSTCDFDYGLLPVNLWCSFRLKKKQKQPKFGLRVSLGDGNCSSVNSWPWWKCWTTSEAVLVAAGGG